RHVSLATCRAYRRAQQIVEPEDVDDVKLLQPGSAIPFDCGVPAQGAPPEPSRQINRPHTRGFLSPAERRSFCLPAVRLRSQTPFDPPIAREHRHLVAPPRQPFRQRFDFHRCPAEFEKRSVAGRDLQDSHCSRRIFLNAFAKTLKRNSSSTRW